MRHIAFALAALALVAGIETPVVQPVDTIVEEVITKTVEVKANSVVDPLTGIEVTGPTIFMITDGNCSWCKKWWAMFADTLKGLGWRVEEVVGNYPGVKLYPTFSIYDLKKWHRHNGYMSMQDLNRLLGRVVQETKTPISSRLSTTEIKSLIAAKRPSGWRGPVYADVAPRSQAKQHLVGSEHGFSWDQVSGLSQNEALILHDLAPHHGNQIFPYRSGSQPAKQTMASGGCPNGGCPNQSSRTSRFRWWR